MLLEERLSKILNQLDLFQMPERNARIVELYLGMDGKGTRTFEDVQEQIGEEFGDPIGRERIRILGKQGISEFQKKFLWNSFFESLYDFVLAQSPIEYSLLTNRLADPDFESFSSSKSTFKPFSKSPFETSGLLKILELRPKDYKGISKPKLVSKRIMYSYQRKKSNEDSPTPRNSIPACRFVVPEDFKVNLDTLVSHAERGVKFNGMLQESSLTPLMPTTLPVHKREELAHSLVVNNKDFLWLDESKGWFTFTCHLENRITNIVAKIFKATQSIHINLLAHLVTRAARMQREVLKGESSNIDFKVKSEYLKNVSFGSGSPEFSVRDAELTLVKSGLCKIDKDNYLTPTDLFTSQIENEELLDATKIFIDVLKNAPNGVLSQSDFREKALQAKSEYELPKYIQTINTFVDEGIFIRNQSILSMNKKGEDIFLSTSKEVIFEKREILNERIRNYNDKNIDLIARYKSKLADVKDATREVRKLRKLAKDTGDSEKIVECEEKFQNLLLLAATCLPPLERVDELEKSLARSNKNLKTFEKSKNELRLSFEKSRLEHIEYQMGLVEKFKSNEYFKEFFLSADFEKMSLDELTASLAESYGLVPDSTLKEFCEYCFIKVQLDDLASQIDNLPPINDKYRNLVFESFKELARNGDGVLAIDEPTLRSVVTDRALAEEKNHAIAHYNQHLAYSPLIYRVDWAQYTYVGNPNFNSYYEG